MKHTIEQIRAMLDAATPGPWFWRVGLKSHCETTLFGKGRVGHDVVLSFVRRGMNGATVRFNVDGIMHRADEIAVPRKSQEHNAAWNSTLTHPDAVLIQEAPTIIGDLLTENARLRKLVADAYSEGYSDADWNVGLEMGERGRSWGSSDACKALGEAQ